MPRGCLLIGDLGGTNARFALAQSAGPGFDQVVSLDCAAHDSVESAIDEYLLRIKAPRPEVICLAVAGPVGGPEVKFLNNHWTLRISSLNQRFPDARVRLVNDFQAVAYAVPFLGDKDLEAIGPARPRPQDKEDFTIGVLGPGTGLGVSGLLRVGGALRALSSEGGHWGFAPESSVQVQLLNRLRERFDRVSDERLVSGPGVENIYQSLCGIQGRAISRLSAPEIFDRAGQGVDRIASETVDLFFEVLGQVAGNLALTLGAGNGIFLAGGIARRYPERLKSGHFRAGFERKGRHRSLMQGIPTWLITHPYPGLLGASYLATSIEAR